ncbi:MAG: hypothetical protein J6S57_01690 [Alphaproteobacteria bacterium]|nr:hypothetical protein [Alphaproteobacteria bacterium]
MLKKIIRYLFFSIIFGLVFTVLDMVSQKSILGIGGNSLAGVGLNSLGMGQLNIGNIGLDFGDIGMDKSAMSGGMCSFDKPLLLTNGECVACNYTGGGDVLMGCEQCPNTKVNCLFNMDSKKTKNTKSKILKSVKSKKISKEHHQYTLVNIIGIGGEMRATLIETDTGRKKIISIGDVIDGATVKSVSMDDGIIVEKNGVMKKLDVGN